MKNRSIITLLLCSLAGIAMALIILKPEAIPSPSRIKRMPQIDPDYSGITLPPNIAPLNFLIKEPGSRYLVKISSVHGDTIRVHSNSPKIHIPPHNWKKLLSSNRGAALTIDIYSKKGRDGWQRFDPITNTIAAQDLDGFLVYRKILGYQTIPDMAIRQRALGTFDDKTILDNRTLSTSKLSCINCHSFCANKPGNMLIHMRGSDQGMLLVRNKKVVKIDTRTKFNKSPASYPSWHPTGKLIAFAVMKVTQALHSTGDPRVVFDEASDLIIYNVETNTISTFPLIADPKRMETLPEWSPDGRYLYFCSAPQPEKVDDAFYNDLKYNDIKYDLMRIPFDIQTGKWGALDTVLTAQATGMSNVQPKISPDDRFLLFVMTPYSYFAGYNDKSDLALLDIATRNYRRLNSVNSDFAESFHSWSSNGRWFVFNSRRRDGICGLPYFAHVDSMGVVSKPFLLPQHDPDFYATYLKSFNVPVLVSRPVEVDWREISSAANNVAAEKVARFISDVRLDGITEASTRAPAGGGAP